MKKEIYVDKVKINKIGSIIYVVGILFMLIFSLVIIIKGDATERINILAWVLLAICGYWMWGKFELIYSKVRKKKKVDKKINKKAVDKFAIKFALLYPIILIINVVIFSVLLNSNLSNFAVIILYFPMAIGSSIVVVFSAVILFLWKNNFEINRILERFKKKKNKK